MKFPSGGRGRNLAFFIPRSLPAEALAQEGAACPPEEDALCFSGGRTNA